MNLKRISLDDFLCSHNQTLTSDNPTAFNAEVVSLIISQGLIFKKALGSSYSLYEVKYDPQNLVIMHNKEVVGYYYSEVIAIDDAHRGIDLSIPLIIEAVESRTLPKKRTLSCAGKAALTKAWRVANGDATCRWYP